MQRPDRSKLVYNEEALKEASKRAALPFTDEANWYPFEVVDVETIVGETEKTRGDLVVVMVASAFNDIEKPGDPTHRLRPSTRERFTVPVGNPSFPGHEAPSYSYGMTRDRLLALYDASEIPRLPRKNKDTGELEFDGQAIEKSDENEAREKVMKATTDLAVDLYFGTDGADSKVLGRPIDITDLKGRVFLGRIGYAKDKQGNQTEFVNILQLRHVEEGLPDGAQWGPAYRGQGALVPAIEKTVRRAPAKKKSKK